jgi:pimeloyl-ACP methyl ester carboxylesterase
VLFPNGLYLLDDFQHLAAGRTLVFYDLRNRGRSDAVADAAKRKAGLHKDVEDLEAVRRHFGAAKVDLVAHSYVGLMVILYAMCHAACVRHVVQLSPMEPHPGKQYPAHLKWSDDVMRDAFGKLAQLQKERGSRDPEESCRKFWAILRAIYIADPANAARINWGRCDLPNERSFLKYWSEDILPSIQGLDLTPEQLANVSPTVLTIHGTKDRSIAYGGAREWAMLLPNARLITLENVAHAPWIEAPEKVFGAVETFLSGDWPESAEKVESLEPGGA